MQTTMQVGAILEVEAEVEGGVAVALVLGGHPCLGAAEGGLAVAHLGNLLPNPLIPFLGVLGGMISVGAIKEGAGHPGDPPGVEEAEAIPSREAAEAAAVILCLVGSAPQGNVMNLVFLGNKIEWKCTFDGNNIVCYIFIIYSITHIQMRKMGQHIQICALLA